MAKVHDRHSNFTKYGFPSTYQEKNDNAIKNTAMYDPDRNMENENLVNKTNHLQNAVKQTKNMRGGMGGKDMDVKQAAGV